MNDTMLMTSALDASEEFEATPIPPELLPEMLAAFEHASQAGDLDEDDCPICKLMREHRAAECNDQTPSASAPAPAAGMNRSERRLLLALSRRSKGGRRR